ncbi:MAG: hypothetical protein EBS20_08505, partial [Actinobacteria bacterium]|nr:hypothetical protein [Actinomycetota bacterium]
MGHDRLAAYYMKEIRTWLGAICRATGAEVQPHLGGGARRTDGHHTAHDSGAMAVEVTAPHGLN